MTKEELLNLNLTTPEGKQALGRELAMLTVPKTEWKHNDRHVNEDTQWHHCSKYGLAMWITGVPFNRHTEDYFDNCNRPDPIDVDDMGKAIELFRKVTKHINHKEIAKKIQVVMRPEADWYAMDDPTRFFICLGFLEATAAQINLICCLYLKENENEI